MVDLSLWLQYQRIWTGSLDLGERHFVSVASAHTTDTCEHPNKHQLYCSHRHIHRNSLVVAVPLVIYGCWKPTRGCSHRQSLSDPICGFSHVDVCWVLATRRSYYCSFAVTLSDGKSLKLFVFLFGNRLALVMSSYNTADVVTDCCVVDTHTSCINVIIASVS